MTPLVHIDDLRVEAAGKPLLRGVSLKIGDGEAVGVVGASGSGKTTMALAVLGHLRPGLSKTGGTVTVAGSQDLLQLRGGTIGYVGQDPGSALNPYARIGAMLRSAGSDDPARMLERVGLPGEFAHRYPHQLSGGQQQRVVLAIALARSPRLLVLDEPTTALDPVAKAEVVGELRRLRESGVAMLWISHDLDTVAALVDRVVVLDDGVIVEDGPASVALSDPDSAAARQLINATIPPRTPVSSDAEILRGHLITAGYGDPVLHDVGLSVRRGESLAVLGASGVGKTTFARCLAGLHKPTKGTVTLLGKPLAGHVRGRTRQERASVQLVPQNPAESLHPRQDVRTALTRPLRRLRGMRSGLDAEVSRLLDAVGLPVEVADRLPGELSGGQRQRVALARALAAKPDVLVCDEITSALDATTQAGVLALLDHLRTSFGLAIVLITHDARVAAAASDRVLVLAGGRVAAEGATSTLLPRDADCEQLVVDLLTHRQRVLEPDRVLGADQ